MIKIINFITYLLVLECAFVIHEYGHFTEMRKRSVEVAEFSLGIGPALYKYQADGFIVSLRAIPVMAYVAPSKKGEEKINSNLSRFDRFLIYSAGVRNNTLSAVMVILILELMGLVSGYITLKELLITALVAPIRIILLFVSFVIDIFTFNVINLGNNFALPTGEFMPPKLVKTFLMISLLLGFFNALPLYPLDGGKIFLDNIANFISQERIALIRSFSPYVVIVFAITYRRSMKFFDFET